MAAKLDAFLGQFPEVGEAHHLISAAVGQDRARPVHEFVQAAQLRHPLRAGAQHQVVGIAQDDIGAGIAHGLGRHGLDRRGGPHRHEGGRADLAPAHRNRAGPRLAVACRYREGETRCLLRSHRSA